MTPDQLNDLIAEQRESGASYQQIANRLAGLGHPMTAGQVNYRCLKLGIVLDRDRGRYGLPVNGRPFTPAEDQALIEMRLAGSTLEAIAARFGRKAGSIRKRLLILARHDELQAA